MSRRDARDLAVDICRMTADQGIGIASLPRRSELPGRRGPGRMTATRAW
jgi:hypothetical protein